MQKTLPYFLNSLKDSNYVSGIVIACIDFTKGKFFTLLPDSVDREKIYEFSNGGILPQNPIQRKPIGSLPGVHEFSMIPSITNELAGIVEKFLQKNEENVCLIDDVIRNSKDSFQKDVELSECVVFHDQDVYYLINNQRSKSSLIVKCLRNSRAFWHSLCIFSKTSIRDIQGKIITDLQIKDICMNAQFLIVGAYDGEGYVFWERDK